MRPLVRQPAEWTQTAPVKASATREITATAKEVFDALADHERWPEWFTAIDRAERFGDLHDGLGSKRRVFVRNVQVDEEFIVWEPGREWGFSVTDSNFPLLRTLNELVTIQETGPDRVRVTYLMAMEPKPWAVPLVRLARRGLRKNLAEALDNLGPHIERNRAP